MERGERRLGDVVEQVRVEDVEAPPEPRGGERDDHASRTRLAVHGAHLTRGTSPGGVSQVTRSTRIGPLVV